MSSSKSQEQAPHRISETSPQFVRKGVIAGLAGGLGFGLIMAYVNMLPMVGMLIRQNDALTGFVVHMVIGVLYGIFWWFFGALFLMPILLGMPQNIFVIGQMQWESLVGHLVYGVIISLVINMIPG